MEKSGTTQGAAQQPFNCIVYNNDGNLSNCIKSWIIFWRVMLLFAKIYTKAAFCACVWRWEEGEGVFAGTV